MSSVIPQMRIGFDAKRAYFNSTGIGNYSRTLIRQLSMNYPDHLYYLYTPPIKKDLFGLERPNLIVRTPQKVTHRIFSSTWRSILMAGDVAKDSLDLYHGLTHELPRKIEKLGVKTAVTVHDLIFFRYPKQYRWIDRNVYEWKYRTSCNVADRVVAISEQTKLDLIEYFGVPPEKISVLYQSCDEGFYADVDASEKDRIRSRYGLPKRYVLYVGSFTERKNTIALVHAFAKIQKKHDVQLVLVGGGGLYRKKMEAAIQDLGISDSVQMLSGLTSKDLPAVYQMAQSFVYPSLFEGFGIPIIEALFSKVPVITSSGSCFLETGGPGSIYVEPTDIAQLAESLDQLLSREDLRKKMVEEGHQYVQRFHHQETTRRHMEFYQGLVAGTL